MFRLLLGYLASSLPAATSDLRSVGRGLRAIPLNLQLNESPEWRHVATIEVHDSFADLIQLVRDDALRFQLRRADKCPQGCLWYEIFVETGGGDRRVARTAWAVLTALKKSAEAGFIQGMRIISGAQWLTLGDNNPETEVDEMRPNNLALH